MQSEAIKAFSKVKSVEEWNSVFDKYKRLLDTEDMAKITTSGLIVRVLGKDQK